MESTIQRNATKNVQANYLCYEGTLFGVLHIDREFFTGDVKAGLQNRPPDVGLRSDGGEHDKPNPCPEHRHEATDMGYH